MGKIIYFVLHSLQIIRYVYLHGKTNFGIVDSGICPLLIMEKSFKFSK